MFRDSQQAITGQPSARERPALFACSLWVEPKKTPAADVLPRAKEDAAIGLLHPVAIRNPTARANPFVTCCCHNGEHSEGKMQCQAVVR